ncbi:MAG: hypothetical protein ACRDZ3_03610 [Acidimicrobiia bacterium]
MTSFTVGLDDALAARLARRAAEAGLAPLIQMALTEFLGEARESRPASGERPDPFSWVGLGESVALRGARVDELLAEGFEQ